MSDPAAFAAVPLPLQAPLSEHGFTELTPVQQAVLSAECAGRDLRITSQTGSGKTVAVGFLLADHLERVPPSGLPRCQPRALVITPTRELANQVAQELTWLLKPVHARVLAVTGGTSVRQEQRTLSLGAEVVVATPGRLLDHLTQEVLDPAQVNTVVLDEADQMLDLGFRDELEGILGRLPAERRTHLVSATFARQVLELARRYQRDALHVEGTTLGASNADIAHVVHLVRPAETLNAIVNLLLLVPDELTLMFVRTRADAAGLAQQLASLGFSAAALTGEMDQPERQRVMRAFRSGVLRTLVATDVAARGIDVPEVTRVIQVDPPKDPDIHTHRSGRTGRAGRKGTSIVLVPPAARLVVLNLLRRAGVQPVVAPVPDAATILRAADDRLVAELTASSAPAGDEAWEPHLHALATRLLETVEPLTLVHRLLAGLGHQGVCPARTVTPVEAPPPRPSRPQSPPPGSRKEQRHWVTFRISSGSRFEMDARRLLATVCRRGDIRGTDVGAIRIGSHNSTFQVDADVAEHFGAQATRPDRREPRVRIEPLRDDAPADPGTRGERREARFHPAAAPQDHPAPPAEPREPTVPPQPLPEAPPAPPPEPTVRKQPLPEAPPAPPPEPTVRKPPLPEAPPAPPPEAPEPTASKEPVLADAPVLTRAQRRAAKFGPPRTPPPAPAAAPREPAARKEPPAHAARKEPPAHAARKEPPRDHRPAPRSPHPPSPSGGMGRPRRKEGPARP